MCKKFECIFYSPSSESCDYMILTGERRGCPATDKCIRFRTEVGDTKILRKRWRPRNVDPEALARLEKHYDKNVTVDKLRKRANVSEEFARTWLVKVHPENINVSRKRYYV